MKCREALKLIDFQIPEEDELDFNIFYANYYFGLNLPLYNKPKKYYTLLMNQILDATNLDIRIDDYNYYRYFHGHNGYKNI